MKKEFVTYEIAKKLRDIGFNEPCLGGYDLNKEFDFLFPHSQNPYIGIKNSNFPCDTPTAPLWQQAVDWFEEKHNIHIDRIWYNDKVTPPRWVYHVEQQYAGSTYEVAIQKALKLIK